MVRFGAEPGNGFQLVQRAAGMAQRAPRNHRDHHARRRRQRRRDQAGLVSHAAGGMFIHLNARDRRRDPRTRPDCIMRSVKRAHFPVVMPEKNTAMRNADIW